MHTNKGFRIKETFDFERGQSPHLAIMVGSTCMFNELNNEVPKQERGLCSVLLHINLNSHHSIIIRIKHSVTGVSGLKNKSCVTGELCR